MADIYSELEKRASAEKKRLQKETKEMIGDYGKMISELKKGEPTFYVQVLSYWKDYGEKDVSIERKGLEGALVQANRKFDRVNKRTDTQRKHVVHLVTGGTKMLVPEELYKDLIKKR